MVTRRACRTSISQRRRESKPEDHTGELEQKESVGWWSCWQNKAVLQRTSNAKLGIWISFYRHRGDVNSFSGKIKKNKIKLGYALHRRMQQLAEWRGQREKAWRPPVLSKLIARTDFYHQVILLIHSFTGYMSMNFHMPNTAFVPRLLSVIKTGIPLPCGSCISEEKSEDKWNDHVRLVSYVGSGASSGRQLQPGTGKILEAVQEQSGDTTDCRPKMRSCSWRAMLIEDRCKESLNLIKGW